MFGVPFEHVPLLRKEDKPAQEARIDELLAAHNIDTIILARCAWRVPETVSLSGGCMHGE
jgi:formyltetrahydrofolate hydrolase